jgi:hypothetical protein
MQTPRIAGSYFRKVVLPQLTPVSVLPLMLLLQLQLLIPQHLLAGMRSLRSRLLLEYAAAVAEDSFPDAVIVMFVVEVSVQVLTAYEDDAQRNYEIECPRIRGRYICCKRRT